MALRGRGFMSVGAAVACCALAAACTSEPAPSSTPSLSPAATPTESQIERQMRLDYEAAETAYRANMAEQDQPLPSWRCPIEATPAAQSHRQRLVPDGSTLESLRDDQKGWLACNRQRPRSSAWSRDDGWTASQVGLTSCEDNSGREVLDESGQGRDAQESRALMSRHSRSSERGSRWKVSTAVTTKVKAFEGQPCGACN